MACFPDNEICRPEQLPDNQATATHLFFSAEHQECAQRLANCRRVPESLVVRAPLRARISGRRYSLQAIGFCFLRRRANLQATIAGAATCRRTSGELLLYGSACPDRASLPVTISSRATEAVATSAFQLPTDSNLSLLYFPEVSLEVILMTPMIVLGTGPNSAKSHVSVGLARFLARQGIRVRPFKAISIRRKEWDCVSGKADWWPNSRAARIAWHPSMTPVLLRPLTESIGDLFINDTYVCVANLISDDTLDCATLREADRGRVEQAVSEAVTQGFAQADDGVLLIEGAGSPIDASLDLANEFVFEQLAHLAPRVLITTDAWNGGALASVVGTYACLPARLKEQVVGFILNRPRSRDIGVEWMRRIAEHTGISIGGVIPSLPTLTDRTDVAGSDAVFDAWCEALAEELDIMVLLGW